MMAFVGAAREQRLVAGVTAQRELVEQQGAAALSRRLSTTRRRRQRPFRRCEIRRARLIGACTFGGYMRER
jgi:hypothetical protein